MKQNWGGGNQPTPLLLDLCVKLRNEYVYQEQQQVPHQNMYHDKKIKDFAPIEDKALKYPGLWEKILSWQR